MIHPHGCHREKHDFQLTLRSMPSGRTDQGRSSELAGGPEEEARAGPEAGEQKSSEAGAAAAEEPLLDAEERQ